MDLLSPRGIRPRTAGPGRDRPLDVSAPGRRGSGFTLIELLITIVIVGILAAIAVPQYQETSRRAHETAAKEDLRNLMTAEEIFHHLHDRYSDGTQAGPGDPVLDENGDVLIRTSQGVTLTATGDADGFTAVAGHARADQWWCVNTTDGSGLVESVPPDGSC